MRGITDSARVAGPGLASLQPPTEPKQHYLATSVTKARACDLTAAVCLALLVPWAVAFDAASPYPSMLEVIWRSTTAASSLTLPCLVCSTSVSALKHALVTESAEQQALMYCVLRCRNMLAGKLITWHPV